jgi:hypothetical protein
MNNAQIIKTIAREVFEGHFNKDVIKSLDFIKANSVYDVASIAQLRLFNEVASSARIAKEETARYKYYDNYVTDGKLNLEGRKAVINGRLDEEFRRIVLEEDRRQFKKNPPKDIIQYEDVTNIDGEDYKGKILVLHPLSLNAKHRTRENQVWLATGGFGCSPTALGTTVYAVCLSDGETTGWRRHDFMGEYKGELTAEQKVIIEREGK